ncbi:MAG: transposase [Polyangiales bacterium]
MPRASRRLQEGYCYHILNRGNARATIFHDDADYTAFLRRLAEATDRYAIRLLAFCLMPNHFHLVVQGDEIGSVSRAMHWIQTAYVSRYRTRYDSTGHIFQGRFKCFPVQADDHLLSVMRYVERNPVRARLVTDSSRWLWSSPAWRARRVPWISESPVPLGKNWLQYVDAPQTAAEIAMIHESLRRGAPFGTTAWRVETAKRLNLSASLRPRGRPRLGGLTPG